jgi:formate dehydrogenase subunit beta
MSNKGAVLPAEGGVEAALVGWLKEALDKKVFDALLIPVEVPAGDSFAYLLLQDRLSSIRPLLCRP